MCCKKSSLPLPLCQLVTLLPGHLRMLKPCKAANLIPLLPRKSSRACSLPFFSPAHMHFCSARKHCKSKPISTCSPTHMHFCRASARTQASLKSKPCTQALFKSKPCSPLRLARQLRACKHSAIHACLFLPLTCMSNMTNWACFSFSLARRQLYTLKKAWQNQAFSCSLWDTLTSHTRKSTSKLSLFLLFSCHHVR